MSESEDDEQHRQDVHRFIARSELFRTIRTFIICATVVAALWIIKGIITKILDKPPWLELVLALIAPSGLLFAVFRAIRWYTRNNFSRTKRLESQLDKLRSSSGLQEDGTNPPEDRI